MSKISYNRIQFQNVDILKNIFKKLGKNYNQSAKALRMSSINLQKILTTKTAEGDGGTLKEELLARILVKYCFPDFDFKDIVADALIPQNDKKNYLDFIFGGLKTHNIVKHFKDRFIIICVEKTKMLDPFLIKLLRELDLDYVIAYSAVKGMPECYRLESFADKALYLTTNNSVDFIKID